MKKVKVLLAALLSVTVVLGTVVPTQAASSTVDIEVRATDMDNVSVTVPSSIPIVFNADGSNTLPTNWTIENKSAIAGIHLSKIEMNAGTSGWKLLGSSANVKEMTVNTKSIRFSLGLEGDLRLVTPTNGNEDATGSITYEKTDMVLSSGESKNIVFNVERGAFTNSEASAKAFDMVLTFNFN